MQVSSANLVFATVEMVERRKPLVLASTKTLINSVLSSSQVGGGVRISSSDDSFTSLRLPAGIFRFSKDKADISHPKLASLDDCALVGVSTTILKRLSVTSGSPVSFPAKICQLFS